MKNEWKIVHEGDDENGNPSIWSLEINHEKYGRWCWITDEGKVFVVSVEYGGDFMELMICKTLTSAKRWVTRNLL